jgi:hypothetical protein
MVECSRLECCGEFWGFDGSCMQLLVHKKLLGRRICLLHYVCLFVQPKAPGALCAVWGWVAVL